ncbi:hypothetical protein LLH00_00210 [bacterium]|nr:hypothetical protein [bacterium]
MPDTCPELKGLLAQVEGRDIPSDLRAPIEAHLESCHACRADFNRFLKIGNILQRTVYGNPNEDRYISYLSHLTGRRMRWSSIPRTCKPPEKDRRMLFLLLKVFIGFLVAAAAGASLAVILGRTGMLGRKTEIVQVDSLDAPAGPFRIAGSQETDSAVAVTAAPSDTSFPLPDSVSPGRVLEALNSRTERDSGLAPADSAGLKAMQAELGALRDALSRNPRDADLQRRTVEKSRQVLEEKRRLGLSAQVKDYYNLGWAHYQGHEFRQALLVTADGLQSVKIGPTEYLHYLKAMSHYQLASRLLNPLPADTSSNDGARVKGAVLRSQLDADARRQAVGELRRASEEFSAMLGRPELEPVARGWILKLNDQIAAVTTP